ncbi:TonB-dependent receptor [Thioclava sp. GXIMD4215]|uniref:TonB-dependent receptor n=1 Tax=Thioclava sp. GXIMD4215 TaxID=3131928 RepID=UPI00324EB624
MACSTQPWHRSTALGLIMMVAFAPQAMAQEDDPVLLETIRVEDMSQAPAGAPATERVTAQDMAHRQAQSVAEAVASVPGVSVTRENDLLTSNISIRNFGGNAAMPSSQQVVYALDGISIAGSSIYRNSSGQAIDPALLKSVSVLKGPLASLEYGSGIVGGTIAMETINGRDLTGAEGGFRYRQVLGASSNGEGWKTASTLAWAPNESVDFLASYARSAKDNSKDGKGEEIDLGAYNVPSYLLKGRYRFGAANEQALTFTYDRSESVQQNVPFATSSEIAAFGNVNRTRDGHVASVAYSYQPEANPLVDFKLSYSQSRQDFDIEGLGGASLAFSGSYTVDTDTLQATNTAQFSTGAIQHRLRGGVALIRQEHDGIMRGVAGEGTSRRTALFAIDEMDFGRDLTVSLGGRVEHQRLSDLSSNTGAALEDMSSTARSLGAGFEKGLGHDLSLYGSFTYSEALALPEYAGRQWADGTYWGETVSKSRSWEIGVKQQSTNTLQQGDQMTASIGLYRTDIDDNNAYPSTTYQDLRSAGLEAALQYRLANGVYAQASLTTSFYNDYSNDSLSAYSAYNYALTDQARLTLGRQFASGWDLSWTLRAGRAQTIDGVEQAGWGVNDLAVGYTVAQGRLEGLRVDFAVDNIFDKQYIRQYTTSSASYPEAGRDVRLTLSKTF